MHLRCHLVEHLLVVISQRWASLLLFHITQSLHSFKQNPKERVQKSNGSSYHRTLHPEYDRFWVLVVFCPLWIHQ